MIQDFARSFFVRNCLTIVKVRQFLIFITNNSDYLQKARKYGHFTGYKN